MLETMNSVEKNVRNKIVKDEDQLIVRLVTYFIALTLVKCVSDLSIGYQCLVHGSFCVAPAYFDVAAYFGITALIVPFILNFIVYVVILYVDGNYRLRSREVVMFMSLSYPLGSYICQLIFDGFRLTRRFSLYSMYIAWNGWGDSSAAVFRAPIMFFGIWVLGMIWLGFASEVTRPRYPQRKAPSRTDSTSEPTGATQATRGTLKKHFEDSIQILLGPIVVMFAVMPLSSWWVKRVSVLKRVLWWGGLVLMSPAIMSLFYWRAVCRFFAFSSAQVYETGDSLNPEAFILGRILLSILAGALCRVLCGVFGTLLRCVETVNLPRPTKSNDNRLVVAAVSTAFVVSACLVGLICLIGINLDGVSSSF